MTSLAAYLRLPGESTSSRAELVVGQLESAIAVGLISHGERLPPESDLAAQLGVSIGSLRQALTVLREKGVILTRPGRNGGSVVSDATEVPDRLVLDRLRNTPAEHLRDLGDLRASVSASAARLAADRGTEPEVDRLADLAERLARATTRGTARRVDSRFHIELGVVAQSPRLTLEIVRCQGELAPLRWAPVAGLPEPAVPARRHREIVEMIRRGDGAGAHAVAVAHCEAETRALIDAHFTLAEG